MGVAATAPTAAANASAAGPTAVCKPTQDWGSGAQFGCTITNGGTSAMSSWKVEFDLGSNVRMGSYWDALLTSASNHHTFTNRSWNGAINPGASASFGFLVTYSGSLGTAQNCKLNGNPCDGAPTDNPPTVPTNLRSTDVQPTSVALAWEASSDDVGVKNYDVLRGGSVVATVTGTSATVTGLTAGTTYSFTVRARDTADQLSPVSAALSVTTPGTGEDLPPSRPTNLRSTDITSTSAALAWDASTDDKGVKNYDVLRDGTVVATVTGTTANVTGLTPERTYSFTVRARDTADQLSPISVALSVTTPGTGQDNPPTKPGNLRSTGQTTNSVTLAWDASTDDNGVSGYDVLKDGAVAQTVTGTSATVTGLTAGTYKFTVRAKDTAGQLSPLSNEISVTIGGSGGNCRPDGLYQTPGTNPPYCQAYDNDGREKLGSDHQRRIIGYFTSWRDGANGAPRYLASDIPWDKVTHINYAFAHIDSQNKVSVGGNNANNPAIGREWPGVAGAEMDPAYPYKGHFNLLNKFKKQNPNVKTLVSIGGWAESGGYIGDDGKRVASGGFYTMASTQAGINTFSDSVVAFVRQYGFNGADIDYEYATSMNYAGNPDDFSFSNPRRATLMAQYVSLMKTLREKLDAASAADGKYYMLTVAAPASGWLLRGQDSYQVTQYLDYINIMSYDLHGAWNHFVGPNAALYDDNKDVEQVDGAVYSTYGMGYLNTDWAAHYFRGAVPAGRINIGVPYYTRGFQGVTGGTNGLWGKAALPDQTKCPPGTGGTVGSTTPCGHGAVGIDNVWHDLDKDGKEVLGGGNPMWHAKNLQQGIQGSYIRDYGLDPDTDPADRLSGTYQRFYDSTLVAPWLWNASKKVFISTEDDQSITAKADYVVNKGLGGVMIWELAGDYAWDASRNNGQGEWFMGTTLTSILYNKFRSATPYKNLKADGRTMPTEVANVKAELVGFPVGDSNYPISPKLRITNNSGQTIPGGATLAFDYGTSAPSNMSQQSGWTMTVQAGHTGNNVGGLKGDFHRATMTIPSYLSIANGATAEVQLNYRLPIATPSNWVLTFGGKSYALAQDYPRSATPSAQSTQRR
ncbi:glycosyl hydrolase family 18 protein [Spongiactinospora sp. TRM90649]|uniref:chitinase C-terminal domain-containing protein n=1 Tax=Spongiactinospora sp. TRM90649 TaxID=3031114 RepID=UPI0023F62BFB|nr:glycosyl hydrolase family 18 protein [Spongiactinospora sp. TRM90649]MDF5751822.1 glycosyl hydrolase family 18 protein [Spongiactinospora sp. TRM90649]